MHVRAFSILLLALFTLARASLFCAILVACRSGEYKLAASPPSRFAAHGAAEERPPGDVSPGGQIETVSEATFAFGEGALEAPLAQMVPAAPPAKAQADAASPPPSSAPTSHAAEPSSNEPAASAAAPREPGSTPLLIYTATLHMAVFEVDKAIDKVQEHAEAIGGYLVRRDDRTAVVRVPVAKFRSTIEHFETLGDVVHREENVQDVTEQFFDLVVRIKNARAVRDRVEELLQTAKNVEEALSVERELARVTEQIEHLEGQLKRMRELISFSTITVAFQPRPVDHVGSELRLPFGWLDRLGLQELLNL